MPKLPLQLQDKMRNKVQTYVKTYEEPEVDENGKLVAKVVKSKSEKVQKESNKEGGGEDELDEEDEIADLKAQMPLPEGVLKVNLGIPIIVVCNKVDLLVRGDKS